MHKKAGDKMEMFMFLLMLFSFSGDSYVMQPKLTHGKIIGPDIKHWSEVSKQLGDVLISVDEKGNERKNMAAEKKQEEQRRKEQISVKESISDDMTVLDKRTEDGWTQQKAGMDTTKAGLSETKTMENETESQIVKEILINNLKNSREVKTVSAYGSKTQQENDDWPVLKPEIGDQSDNVKQRIVQEEQDGMLVAGIRLEVQREGPQENRKMILTVRQENEEQQQTEREDLNSARHKLPEKEKKINDHTPNLKWFSARVKGESAISPVQTMTESQISSSMPPHYHNVPPIRVISPADTPSVSSPPISHYNKGSTLFSLSSVTPPSHTNTGYISTAAGDVRSVSLVEDLTTEVLQRHGHDPKQEVKANPNLEDVTVKDIQVNPVQKERQTTYKEVDIRVINTAIQAKESPFIFQTQAATPNTIEARLITTQFKPTWKHKEETASPEFKENNPPVNLTQEPDMTQSTGQNKIMKLMENISKVTLKKNKESHLKLRLTKLSGNTQVSKQNAKKKKKNNRSSKNKITRKTEEKQSKKEGKMQKLQEKPTHFPYFMDDYCPPECACYERVVQCSDNGMERVPYGIPYNARYILLTNNNIKSIQLDVLNKYVSMEFLVLTNNHLTDGAIEGAFDGVPALKRLYLDKNLLQSVPTDLPASLEELHLDNNHVSVMSDTAWASCPGLLILSLSNNSLGNGLESLRNAVLSPLCNLRTLNLDHNQLISVPLGLPLSIKELYLKGNFIEQFSGGVFNGISELVVLDLSANRLTNKGLLRESLFKTTHLESLNLEGNRLKQVPQHLPLSLKTLNLEGNFISSVKKAAFSNLKHLENLGLAKNKIFKVAPGVFRTLPVLHQLDLCYNTLHQVPRKLPKSLHSVSLSHNKIQSVPHDAFCWGNKSLSLSRLVQVQLENNLIDLGNFNKQAFRCLRGLQVVHFY